MTLRFAISFFCVSAMAQDLPDARALLKETSTILLQHKSYQLDQQAIFETQGSTPVRLDMLLKMAVSNPGKLRIESGGPLGKSLIVSDGEHSWMYLSALKQYTKTHAASTPESMVKMMLPGMTDPLDQINSKDPFLDVTISGEETVEVEGEKIPCYVVEAKLDMVKLTQSMQLSGGVEKLWIDKKTRLTLKQTMSATLKAGALSDPAEVNQAVSVVSWKLDNEVPDETFHFTPPEDAQLVAEFRGLVKANSDLTGQSAPDFKLTSLDGKEFSLQNLRGKFVLLNFWATWCAPCRSDLPAMEKLHQEFRKRGLVVLGINAGEDQKMVSNFLHKSAMTYPVLLASGTTMIESYKAKAFPTLVLIDAAGKIVFYHVGAGADKALRESLVKLGLE